MRGKNKSENIINRFEEHEQDLREAIHQFVTPFLKKRKLTHLYLAWGSYQNDWAYEYQSPAGPYIFDLASLTKPLVTVPLVKKMLKDSKLSIQTPLSQFFEKKTIWPHRVNSETSVLSLIQHRSQIPSWMNFWTNRLNPLFDISKVTKDERREVLFQRLCFLKSYEGGAVLYSDIGYLLLGVALESFYSKSLIDIFKEFSSSELKLFNSEIFFPDFNHRRGHIYVPTSFCPVRNRFLVGEVHDENSASLGGQCGHSGSFATGQGLVIYLKKLLRSKIGVEILRENSKFYHKVLPGEFLMGWQKESLNQTVFLDEPVYKHLGFTGTGIWIFPKRKAFLIILSNRVWSSRVSDWIQSFRTELGKLIWERSISKLELVSDS